MARPKQDGEVTVTGVLNGAEIERTYPSPGAGMSAALTFASRLRGTDTSTFYVRDRNGDAVARVERETDGRIFTFAMKR